MATLMQCLDPESNQNFSRLCKRGSLLNLQQDPHVLEVDPQYLAKSVPPFPFFCYLQLKIFSFSFKLSYKKVVTIWFHFYVCKCGLDRRSTRKHSIAIGTQDETSQFASNLCTFKSGSFIFGQRQWGFVLNYQHWLFKKTNKQTN